MSEPLPTDPTQPGAPVDTSKAPLRRPYSFLSPSRGPNEIGRLGDYRVLRLLGAGGMGYVFEAEELTLQRKVALKVLRPDLAEDRSSRERFLREARAAAAINSDHVVTIYYVADAAVPYLAMQFLEGESLQERIEKPPPITLRAALEIAQHTAEGLAAAHAVGLTHRDIKPANLWLEKKTAGSTPKTETPGKPAGQWDVANPEAELSLNSSPTVPLIPLLPSSFRVKLLDFGLARRKTGETSLTSTGFIVGTPNFMSPEQAAGGAVDGRADLFSLGCVLYTVLVGELPFAGSSAMAVMMALANKIPPRVDELNPTVPRGVADLVVRLLEKDPTRRPQSAREVIATLDSLLAGISENVSLPMSSSSNNPTDKPGNWETLVPGESEPISLGPLISQGSVPVPVPVPPSAATLAPPPARRVSVVVWVVLAAVVALAGVFVVRALLTPHAAAGPILVGILHSQSGTMAASEMPVIDATLLAIDEINDAGGVLGRQVKGIVADGDSDPDEFGRQAEKLLEEDKVAAIFGCWTSASRKTVVEVFNRRNEGLLFYPVQYEGLGRSQRVIYLGPGPNPQLIPAIKCLPDPVGEGGLGKKRLYLVGSDYVFPRVAHEIIRDQVKIREKDGVRVVGEMFLPLGSKDTSVVVQDIVHQSPDAIVNTLNGGTNFTFFAELRSKNILPAAVPTISLSITENEVMGLNPPALAGDYLVASYFQAIDRPQSREFIRKLRDRYGERLLATDPMAAAYSGVHLWAQAVQKAGTTDAEAVRDALRGMEFDGVRALIKIDPQNLHTWLPARIGKIRPDGRVDLVPGAGSEKLIPPEPFPPTRPELVWDQYLRSLQLQWDGKWQAPEKK